MIDKLNEFLAVYGKEHLTILSDGELTIDEMTLYENQSDFVCTLEPLGPIHVVT